MEHACHGVRRASRLIFFLALFPARSFAAGDDRAALAEFERLASRVDPKAVEMALEASNPALSSKDRKASAEALVTSALRVMDEAIRFREQYPQSSRVAEVERRAIQVLGATIGQQGLKIPKSRAADLQKFVRERLISTPENPDLHVLRFRLVPNLPMGQTRAALEELSQAPTPEPARSMARDYMQRIEWVAKPIDLSFVGLDGREFSAAALKGKVLLITFWSTTSQSSVRGIPEMKRRREAYRWQGFEVVGISLDTDRTALERFVKKEQIQWPQYFHPAGPKSPVAQKFGIRNPPMAWLVGRDGVVRDVDALDKLTYAIDQLLKE